MTAKYFAILTNQGAARLANAAALGTKLNLTQMAVGDANGVLPTPDPAQTKLINQKRIAPLNLLTVDPANTSQIIAEQIIPENEGGFWIREIGLYDDDGILIAVANCPETYKPELQEGSGRTQTIRMILIVSSTSAITLKIDPSVVLATRQYVDDKVIEVKSYADGLIRAHEQSRNHPDATTTAKGFTQLNSSVTDDRETQSATPKAVKIAMDNANARLAKERNLSDLPNPALARQNLQLGDSSTKNTGTTANTVAAGDDARITGAMQKSQNGADIQDVAKFLQNLGLNRFVQVGTNQDMKLILEATEWYVYDSKLKKNIALAVNMGGTGALDATGARTNLGLGNSATKNTGTAPGTVAAGDDSRIIGALQKTGGDVTGPLRRVDSYPNILLTDSTMNDATIGKTVGIEQSKGRVTIYLRAGDGTSSDGQILYNFPTITGSKTLITREECDVRYQQQTRLGAESRYGANDNYIAVPAGCVMTGLDVGGGSSSETFIGYRPLQVNINGSWATINQL